ncbi:MAG: CHRD domain-containing protein [Pyrinomonadaceae bacterium]
MSQINSVSKKGGAPRFLLLMCAAIAFWAALPFVFELASTPVEAHGPRPTLVASLTGEPIGEATPRGSASYYVAATGTPEPTRKLNVSVSNVNLPNGTQLLVSLNDSPIGTITLRTNGPGNHGGNGTLMLSTANGGTVPTVAAGDVLTIGSAPTAGVITYLTGTFAPPPSPSPTSTHTPWPSPSGTPLPARAFAARLNGANEVPPVTTNGMGYGFVSVNSAETQIRVCLGARNLSSDATAITINGPATTSENGPVIFTLTLPTNPNSFSTQTFDVTADQVAQLRARSWYFQVATTNNPDGEIRGQLNPITPRHGGGGHHGGGSGGGGNRLPIQISDDTESDTRTYVPVPFDFDGDGITDIAVFHELDGIWNITQSSDGKTVTYQTE